MRLLTVARLAGRGLKQAEHFEDDNDDDDDPDDVEDVVHGGVCIWSPNRNQASHHVGPIFFHAAISIPPASFGTAQTRREILT